MIPGSDPKQSLWLIDDDLLRLRGRVTRLKSRHAHREFPWSRTRRLTTNVRVVDDRGAELDVEANFIVARFRNTHADQFVGNIAYTLVRDNGSFKIRGRTVTLDNETLGPFGAVSIIVQMVDRYSRRLP